MKSGTESKLKFKKLQRRLGLKLWECRGVLESIWACTLQNTPAGDIGKLTNEDIAAAIEWDRSADELIDALIGSGWLDEDESFRLVVHDWSDHCPNHLKGGFSQSKKQFADVEVKRRVSLATSLASSLATGLATSSERVATNPNLTNPNLTNSIQSADQDISQVKSDPGWAVETTTATYATKSVLKVLEQWRNYHLDKFHSPFTDTEVDLRLMDCARMKWSEVTLIEAINTAMKRGWKRWFHPDDIHDFKPTGPPKPIDRTPDESATTRKSQAEIDARLAKNAEAKRLALGQH